MFQSLPLMSPFRTTRVSPLACPKTLENMRKTNKTSNRLRMTRSIASAGCLDSESSSSKPPFLEVLEI
jgi:hypothetical protein